MNLLKNKDLLRALLKQGDDIHTVHGGVAATQIRVRKEEDRDIIHIKTPSIPIEAYQVVLNMNHLVVYAHLPNRAEHDMENEEHNDEKNWTYPIFYKQFILSPRIDRKGIEAREEMGELQIHLPYIQNEEELSRKINIQKH